MIYPHQLEMQIRALTFNPTPVNTAFLNSRNADDRDALMYMYTYDFVCRTYGVPRPPGLLHARAIQAVSCILYGQKRTGDARCRYCMIRKRKSMYDWMGCWGKTNQQCSLCRASGSRRHPCSLSPLETFEECPSSGPRFEANGNDDADGEGDPGDEAAAVNVSCGSLGEEAHSNQTISTEGSSCIAVALINESEDVHTESSNFDGTFEMSPEVEHAIDDDLRAFEELLTAAASNAIPDDPVTPPASVPVEEWTKIPSHNDIATSPSCLPTFIPASLASTPFEVSAPKSDKQLGRDIVHMWASFQKSLNPITRFDPSLPANRESPMTSNLEPFSCEHVQRLHCDASRFRSAVESAVCSPSFERYAAVNLLMLWQGLEYCLPKEVGSVASQIVPLLRREERLVSGVVSDIAVWCEGRAD